MKYPGKFIVIEGVDGAGKDTQEAYLRDLLPADTIYTREPRGTELGKKLRDLIVTNEYDPITEVLLFYAARQQLVQQVILPALREGKTVVSNRNELTTYAYQVHARERQDLLPLVDYLSEFILDAITPDLCLYYDIPTSVRKERLDAREREANSFDNFDQGFFERAREGYKKHIQKYPHEIIDASGTIEEVKALTEEIITNFLDR